MHQAFRNLGLAFASGTWLFVMGCSDDNDVDPVRDAGAPMTEGATPDSPTSADGGSCGRAFNAPADPGSAGILFTASGEVLAINGYSFPPANTDDPAFVDGWDVHFTHLLTTIDKITLSENPDSNPGDPSQEGQLVAEVDGPWAVDLSHSDPSYLPGKGGPGELAVPIASLSRQNKNGNGSFKTDGTRYAFGFDTIAASCTAQNVNLDSDALGDYMEMVKNQCVVFYEGVATFKGDANYAGCDVHPTWPKIVQFKLCFQSPTTYVNCQNPDNDPATPFANEEHQRGIAFKGNASVIGQVTIHTDHPFWDSVLHDSPAHFDPFAARVVSADAGVDSGIPTVTLEDTKNVDYTAYADSLGNKLQWRYCMDPPTDVHPKYVGAMSFDPETVPHATGDNPATGLRDFYDFSTYNQSTQGHLNSDGLCFVKRNYPSPE